MNPQSPAARPRRALLRIQRGLNFLVPLLGIAAAGLCADLARAAYEINAPIVKVSAGILPTGPLGSSATWANQGSLGGEFTVQGGTGISVSNVTINGNTNCRAVVLPGSANNWFKLSVNPPTTSPIYGTTTVKPVYTVAAWVYTTNLSTVRNCCYTSFTQGGRGANFYYGNGMAAADHWEAGASLGRPADAVWPAGTWHHLVIANNGTTEALYVDGSTTPATSVTGTAGYFGPGPVQIGAALWKGGAQDFFNCQIGAVRIYDAACAAGDVPALLADMVPEVPAVTYTIAATAGAGGTISPSGTRILAPGLNQTYTITAAVGNVIADVKVDNVSQGAIGSYTFTNVQANHTIDATFTAVPTATVTASAGPGGTISPSGATTVNAGTSPVFSILPTPGNYVVDVLVDGVSVGAVGSHTFTSIAAGAHTISATFASNGDLIARYLFDESDGAVAADASPNHLDANLLGGFSWVSGKYDNAVNLGGANGYAVLPDGIASGLGDFTITAWVNLTTSPFWGRIFDIGSGTGQYMFLAANVGSNLMRYAIKNGGGEQVVNSSVALPTGSWQHVAVTRSGNTVTLYLNGVACGSNPAVTIKPSDLGTTTQSWIGRSQYNDPYLNGSVDDFRIYAKPLTVAEIVEVMTGGVRVVSGTVVDGGSNPVAATVVLKLDGAVVQTFNTAADGVFSFVTGPGVYTVEASKPYAKVVAPAAADATTGDVTGLSLVLLDYKATIQVSDSNGPLANAVVRLGGVGTTAKVTDATGQVDMDVPAAGANELYVDAAGHGMHIQTVNYVAGTAQVIPVTLSIVAEPGVYNADFSLGSVGWAAFGSTANWSWGGVERLGNGFPAANADMYSFAATGAGTGALDFGAPHPRPGVTWPPLPHTAAYTGTISELTETTLTDSGATWTNFLTGFNQWGDAVEVTGTDGKTRAYPIRSFDVGTHTITLVPGATLLTDGLAAGSTYRVLTEVFAWWYPGYLAPAADRRVPLTPGCAYNFYFKMKSTHNQGQPSSALVWRDSSGTVLRRDVVDWTPGGSLAQSVPRVMVLPPAAAATVEPEFAIRDSGAFVEYLTKSGGIEVDEVVVDAVRVPAITATAGTGGTISPVGVVPVLAGGEQTFTITPASGYEVKDVVVDGSLHLGPVTTHTFTNVTGDHTIAASFDPLVVDLYQDWIQFFYDPEDPRAAKDADPDRDGQDNFTEFAIDGDPASGVATGKVRSRVESVDGQNALLITFPALEGAVFEGTTSLSATIGGVVYTVEGSNDLFAPDQVVTEVSPPRRDGMPDPYFGWTYHTFRLAGAVPARGVKGFLNLRITPQTAAP